ncbi:hypothetical protein Lalb_Chr14g0376161 [Lupinus albus]|uniref:Uncharacterized protein n=1 Tax=Lupinus albus TaxID=3870 RepID=A0A6A4PGZ1_LUPAL|nr:hypothetical protein Lalb_Chr14g0376161 [Lupinus albus]
MEIFHKMIYPMRRLWLALSSRLFLKSHHPKHGLLKLEGDIQTCGYEDVQVMWEMLQRTENEVIEDTTTTTLSSSNFLSGGSLYGPLTIVTQLHHNQQITL